MNIRKLWAILLSIIVSATLIGVAFSSWYFKKENLNLDNKASVYVVSDVTKGDIEILQSPSMIIFSEGFGRKDDLTDGIEFYTEKDSSYEQENKVVLKYTIKDQNDSIDVNLFRLYISIEDSTFSKYVSLTSSYSKATETEGGYDFSNDLVTYKDSDTGLNSYFLYTLKLNNAIQYKSSDKKPTTKDNYKNLCSALNNAKITIKFVVK